jgi:hypothetical protein
MIVKQKEWDECVGKNKDAYGKACVDVGRRVMEILDEEPEFNCHEIICRADKEVKAGGITGFMAACVAQMVWQYHDRGEEFREKWNQDHGVDESKAKGGIVNPAIMEIG